MRREVRREEKEQQSWNSGQAGDAKAGKAFCGSNEIKNIERFKGTENKE